MYKLSFTIFIVLFAASVNSEDQKFQATKGPIFTEYGPVFKIEDRDLELKKDFKYRVFFDITESSKETFNLNRRFESIARFINMHAMNGVKMKDMEIAVVVHGTATRDVLTHQAYEELYLEDNPTLELIEQLHSKGVKFYLCGQSLYFMKLTKAELAPQVNLALSAMTTSTMLQAEGYTLIP